MSERTYKYKLKKSSKTRKCRALIKHNLNKTLMCNVCVQKWTNRADKL